MDKVSSHMASAAEVVHGLMQQAVFEGDDIWSHKQELLPKSKSHLPTLVLDLDETLIHSSVNELVDYDHFD